MPLDLTDAQIAEAAFRAAHEAVTEESTDERRRRISGQARSLPERDEDDADEANRRERAIVILIEACEFGIEVLSGEIGPETVFDDAFAERFEAVCRLTHAIKEAREAFAMTQHEDNVIVLDQAAS